MVPLMGGAFVGVLVNRFDARPMIALSFGLAMAVNAFLVPVAIADELSFWHLVLAAFAAGIALSIDFTVRRPLVGSVVSPELIGKAVSIDFVPNTLARVLAPALTGILIEAWGFATVFAAGTFVYGLGLVGALGLKVTHDRSLQGGIGMDPVKEGFRFARGKPAVLEVLAMTTVMNLFVFPFRHFVPVIGTAVLGLTISQVGFLTAAEGLGMTIGSVALVLRVRPNRFSSILKGGTALAALGAVTFGVSTWVPISLIAVVVVGMGVSAFATMQSAVVVAAAPPALRSQVMGLVGSLIGTNPLGLLLLGAFAVVLGPAGAVVASGSIGFGVAAFATIRSRQPSVSGIA